MEAAMQELRELATQLASRIPSSAKKFEPACARCNDYHIEITPSGSRPCPDCALNAQKARLLARIEEEYKPFRLDTVQPDSSRHAKQADVLNYIRANPDKSYAFFGKNGAGKTLWGWLLYRNAVEQGRKAVGIKLLHLLEEYTNHQFDDSKPPAISPATLREAQSRYLIFLDDITVAPTSEYAGRKLYDLMDAIKGNGHQLIVTAHVSGEQVEQVWNRSGFSMGPAIYRRIIQSDEMVKVKDLF